LKFDIEKLRDLPRRSSEDYLELMHLALETNDKAWFEELAKKKAQLEREEEEIRRELGWKGK
jgi:hypothetical protein